MSDQTNVLTERIAFAEEWLDRAKQQLADGNVAHGSLHLILAEAELHRAREVSAATRTQSAAPAYALRWPVLIAGAAALAGVAAALLLQVAAIPGVVESGGAPSLVVTFPAQNGDLLRMVSIPEPPSAPMIVERTVERTIVKPMIVRVTVPVSAQPRSAAPAPAVAPATPRMLEPASAPAPQAAPAAQPAVVVAPPAPPVLSEADVIDLVLAAERSLRRPTKH